MQEPKSGTAAPQNPRRIWGEPHDGWRRAVYRVTFESDTAAGRLFDKLLVLAIISSVLVVIADSVPLLNRHFAGAFTVAEWFFTVLFTIEYSLRFICLRQPRLYAFSFFGIIDLIAVLPTYLALVFPGIHVLVDVRVLRLLRIFRIFKLTAYISEYQALLTALRASSRKIMVFLSVVVLIIVVMGSLMYVIEGPENGFTSIPTSIYWAVTTMTTVGFGDIAPQSALGRFITSLMMLVGWGTLAVPTGIVTTELALRQQRVSAQGDNMQGDSALHLPGFGPDPRTCLACGEARHPLQARFCHQCGATLDGAPQ